MNQDNVSPDNFSPEVDGIELGFSPPPKLITHTADRVKGPRFNGVDFLTSKLNMDDEIIKMNSQIHTPVDSARFINEIGIPIQ